MRVTRSSSVPFQQAIHKYAPGHSAKAESLRVSLLSSGDLRRIEQAFQRAINCDPNDATVLLQACWTGL
jgi:hypothetical protein